jgi:hypothetical protein
VNDRPLEYLCAHLEEALTTDGRVAEQGTHVDIEDGHLIVRGTVSTPQRRAAIDDIAREIIENIEVRNEVTVLDLTPSDDEEPVT